MNEEKDRKHNLHTKVCVYNKFFLSFSLSLSLSLLPYFLLFRLSHNYVEGGNESSLLGQ